MAVRKVHSTVEPWERTKAASMASRLVVSTVLKKVLSTVAMRAEMLDSNMVDQLADWWADRTVG